MHIQNEKDPANRFQTAQTFSHFMSNYRLLSPVLVALFIFFKKK